jgi:hypothetical protein
VGQPARRAPHVVSDDEPPVGILEAWQARKSDGGTPEPPATPAADNGHTEGRPAYGQAILDGELARVRAAVKGERNGTLNVAAVKVARAVAGGHLDENHARSALAAAAHETGLGFAEIRNTIRSGFRYGRQYPRDPGPPNASRDETTGPGEPVDLTDRLTPAAPATPAGHASAQPQRPALDLATYLRPATFLLDLPPNPPAIWGEGDTVLWAPGEALMIASLPGLGKTTLAGQLVRARLGLDDGLLDLPVLEGKRVLWLLMDRPQQIARSILRQFEREELEGIGDRLVLGWGPPPADVAKHPELLAELCHSAQADTLVVDSLKDAALKLTDDEVGAAYNRARQTAITSGVEVLELHHLVKRNAEGKAPDSLADVYGSAWLTAGAGSVVVLVGQPGDPIVRAHHLKQPREPWGPLWLAHDHGRGATTVHNRVDLLERLAVTGVQTASSAATLLYETEKPSRAQIETARRRLDRLVRDGLAYTTPGRPGGEGGSSATRYHPTTRTPDPLPTPWEASREDDDR